MAGDGQGYPCWRHDMMMMMIYIYIYIGDITVTPDDLMELASFCELN